MFAGSIATVALVIIVAFVFRSSIKKANETLPEVVNTTLGTLVKGSQQLDSIITVNCLESDVELQHRVAEVERQIESLGGIKDINALYRQLHS